MKRAHFSMICGLIIAYLAAFAVSCGSEEQGYNSYDLFSINDEMRAQVTEGVKNLDPSYKDTFEEKLEALVDRSNMPEITNQNSIQPYMDTSEYQEFKRHILSNAPGSYYLLIDIFLSGDVKITPFNYMFQDIVDASYPGLINKVLDKLEGTTVEEFMMLYSEVCVEFLLQEITRT
ncbi:MAG: hypothetical protein LUG96_16695 [Tannerellaceae bacterium]|nr:hypothetical protein [Tannerellaceae bacterium]